MILWQHLRRKMLQHAHQIVSEKDAKMTYEELVIFAESLAEKLKNERCCAIYCKSELSCAMALLGCFAANVTAVPLSHRYGEKHCCGALASGSGECEGESDFGIHSSRSEFLCRLKNLFGNPPMRVGFFVIFGRKTQKKYGLYQIFFEKT